MPNRGTIGDEAKGSGGGPNDHTKDQRCGTERPGVLQPVLHGGPEGGGNEVQ